MQQSELNWITGYLGGITGDVLRNLYVRGKNCEAILPCAGARVGARPEQASYPGEATSLTSFSAASAMSSSASSAVVVIVLLKWTCTPFSMAALPCS